MPVLKRPLIKNREIDTIPNSQLIRCLVRVLQKYPNDDDVLQPFNDAIRRTNSYFF